MSTLSSKHGKRHGLLDPVSVLIVLVFILALLIFAPLADDARNSFSGTLGNLGSSVQASASSALDFTADRAYWEANCSHGWTSNVTCENIVLRTQSCAVSVASAYCSEYDAYLEQFRN